MPTLENADWPALPDSNGKPKSNTGASFKQIVKYLKETSSEETYEVWTAGLEHFYFDDLFAVASSVAYASRFNKRDLEANLEWLRGNAISCVT